MALDIVAGEFYELRNGKKVEVLKTGLDMALQGWGIQRSKNNPLCILAVCDSKGGGQSMLQFYAGGVNSRKGPTDFDIIGPWVEPVYTFFPVLKSGPIAGVFETYEAAATAGAQEATETNGIVGFGRIEHTKSKVEFFKAGALAKSSGAVSETSVDDDEMVDGGSDAEPFVGESDNA